MNQYRLSPAARDDLVSIVEWIADDDLAAAFRLRDRLFAAFAKLTDMPGLGHVRDDVVPRGRGLRFWRVAPYLIVYRLSPGGIEIVRVVHGARDLPALLDDGS
jgi:toxin ParE1/3/4